MALWGRERREQGSDTPPTDIQFLGAVPFQRHFAWRCMGAGSKQGLQAKKCSAREDACTRAEFAHTDTSPKDADLLGGLCTSQLCESGCKERRTDTLCPSFLTLHPARPIFRNRLVSGCCVCHSRA